MKKLRPTRYARQRPIGPSDSRVRTRGKHGLTRAEIDAIVAAQGFRCPICGRPDPNVVDHDHEKAKLHPHPVGRGCRFCIRSVTCAMCNSLLGFARDDPATLRRAALYLERSRGVRAGA